MDYKGKDKVAWIMYLSLVDNRKVACNTERNFLVNIRFIIKGCNL